jgi:hypothetical protein
VLSKRHYNNIAGKLYNVDMRARTPPQKQAVEYLRAELISLFAADNPRFDEGKFRKASCVQAVDILP